MKWSELKALGVRRCCVMFNNGRRCRRRVEADSISDIPYAEQAGGSTSWCDRHVGTMAAAADLSRACAEGMKGGRR